VDEKRVSWKHLEAVYNLDKVNPIRMMPKLTDRHLDPGPLLAMKVKLATQLFSHQVAASLSMCAAQKLLPAEVGHTAEFVNRMDKLFDIMNSRKLYADKPARCALTMSSDNMQHLEQEKAWIENWRFVGAKSQTNIASHWGLSVTIDSILSLTKELLSEGFNFVCTSRFNQDCIENFFSIIRSKGGWNDRPTARQFRAAYQNALVLLSVEKSKSNANCLDEEDFDIALDIHSCIELARKSEPAEKSIFRGTDRCIRLIQPPMSMECRDEEIFSESIENVLSYIAGWLIRKSRLCNECEATLCIPENSLMSHHSSFIEAKKYTSDSKLLQPTSLVQSLVHEMEVIFQQNIKNCLEGVAGIAQMIMNTINNQCNFSFLFSLHAEHALHLQDSLVRNFVITRIYYYVKFYNRELSPRNKKNEKKMARVIHK